MLIKDLLTIDLSEDIKNVIDLEDISEAAIQSEIESYIITEGLAREYSDFVSVYTSNIIETGVWLSGFYGSGKSYFGKLLGYMMSNRMINGTPARDRILQRFTGIDDESLVKNVISKLNSIHSRVVLMDVARQDTSNGFAYALFRNFLKSLELPENEHGFLLFSLMCDSGYGSIVDFFQDKAGLNWTDFKYNRTIYFTKIKELYCSLGNSEADYSHIMSTIRREIDEFDSAKLKQELNNYLQVVRDEKIVFLFDEASEAINQGKFTLLDLQGLSESLSSLGGKVWTIAIAQEKLDDVINNSNINRAQLTKVTDRFKTKIHLEATEVDVIIRSRLLKKKDAAIQLLNEHYQQHSGKIADHSGLTGVAKTETPEAYITYYPFYKNQFTLLQNFLFGRQGYASTKVAARGMIITAYDILKHEIQHEKLFSVATGWQIAKEAQPQPPVRLVNRFTNAELILQNEHIDLPGRHLLETIHFLTEAEVAPATLSNIVKSHIKSPDDYHTIQSTIAKALELLVEQKVLLLTNGTYRITSDIEQRLLDEMNQFQVQPFRKKQLIISAYKNSALVRSLARLHDNNTPYDFYISSDNDDELTNPAIKQLKLKVKSIYSYGNDRITQIEQLKTQYQNNKDVIWLAPEDKYFREIDRLLEDAERIKYLEEKYTNPQSDEGPIVRGFQAERSVKENRLKELVEQSLMESTAVYLYNTAQLDKNNWLSLLNGMQRQVIQNVYSQRLSAQLSDAIAERIIKEASNQRLHTFFNGQGADFQFFDVQGNFVGENLKPAEQILFKVRNSFVDGATLEKDLEQPPTGFGFGTVMTTVAALMRGNKLMAKHNGADKFSWKDEGVATIFTNAREFRRASFKAIARSLSTNQKNSIVTALQDLDCETHTSKRIDWNTNDFDLVTAIRDLAKRFCEKVDDMKRQQRDFDALFGYLETSKELLGTFTGAVSEANYIDKAENFLTDSSLYKNAVEEILKAEKFIRNNLDKVRQWKTFADGVQDELNKAATVHPQINAPVEAFGEIYRAGIVTQFRALQDKAQQVKDAYYNLMTAAAREMSDSYKVLYQEAVTLQQEIDTLPLGLNEDAASKANTIANYAQQRTSPDVDIDYDVKDRQTRFTYSEILSFIELFSSRKTALEIIRNGLIRNPPPVPDPSEPEPPKAKKYVAALPGRQLKVHVYKTWLQQELQKLADAADQDDIEIN
jgi:hypothetical protein